MEPLQFGFGLLESLGVNARIGIWIVFLMTAFYIWRTLKIGSRVSYWLVVFAFTLVVIGAGLALGVITGVDVGRFFGLVQVIISFFWEITERIMQAL